MPTVDDYQLIALFVAIALILHLLVKKIIFALSKKVKKTKTKLDDYLLQTCITPVKLIIWLTLIYSILQVFSKYYEILNKVFNYLDASYMVIFLVLVLKIIKSFENYFSVERQEVDKDVIHLLAKISKIVIIFVISLAILQFLGINISSILAFGGVGTLIIGMAAKDMLANIFGGLMISLDKPFSVGDWIRVDNIEGVVEIIGWRTTRIRTFNKNPIYVPNSLFSTKAIETPSRMTNRRIKEIIGLRYDDISKIKNIEKAIIALLASNDSIDHSVRTMVYFDKFNNSSVDLIIYAFTKITDKLHYQQLKSDILLEIYKIITENDADIAYPTQTININNTK